MNWKEFHSIKMSRKSATIEVSKYVYSYSSDMSIAIALNNPAKGRVVQSWAKITQG